MKSRLIISLAVFLCSTTGFASQSNPQAGYMLPDSVNAETVYINMLQSAYRDGNINENERYLLKSLQTTLHLPDSIIIRINNTILRKEPTRLDQSGRWPLVIQNVIIGSGLYGWTVPLVLGAENDKWFIGSEMLSLGGAFYLTYQYTKNMNISYSRAQMMRGGSLLGLRYGWLFNDILDAWPSDTASSFTSTSKGWALTLMASVPAGLWAGDYLYKRLQPSHGQAWALTLWGDLGGYTATSLHRMVDGTQSKPDRYDYENYGGPPNYTYSFDQQGYNKAQRQYLSWKRLDAVMEMAGYPLGIYLGHRLFGENNYTFGDALMLYEGRWMGWLYGALTAELFDIKHTSPGGILLRTAGSLGGPLLMNKFIARDDYSFGESALMAVGTGSGMAFGAGLAAITSINESNVVTALVMASGVGGFFLTHSILDIASDGTYSSQEPRRSFDVIPSFSLQPVRDENKHLSFQSFFSANVRF